MSTPLAIIGHTNVQDLRATADAFGAYPPDTTLMVEIDDDGIDISAPDAPIPCSCTRAHDNPDVIAVKHVDCPTHGSRWHRRTRITRTSIGHGMACAHASSENEQMAEILAAIIDQHSPDPETAAQWPGISDPLCRECSTADRAVRHPCPTRSIADRLPESAHSHTGT